MTRKKIFWLLFLSALILLLAAIYFLIPANLNVSAAVTFHGNASAVSRSIASESDWRKWWPGEKPDRPGSGFLVDGYHFELRSKLYHALGITIRNDASIWESRITIFSPTRDSILLLWNYHTRASRNPLTKAFHYYEALRTKKIMDNILAHAKQFLQNRENIYQIRIAQIMSRDSTLITTKFRTAAYPATAEIYHAIYELKDFIAQKQARENNFPMKQTSRLENGGYETMVAIPVNKALKDEGKFILKRYVPWKEMMGEVTGGDSTISRGFSQFKIFLQEYQYMQMTTPFELLVTDRSREPDTTKWVTRFICPIP